MLRSDLPLRSRIRIASLVISGAVALLLALWLLVSPGTLADGHPWPLIGLLVLIAVFSGILAGRMAD